MDESTIEVTSRDGIQLQVYRWAPDGELRAVVQIQHGLGEHALRYKRFAQALTEAGYLVYAPDGRGSGRTAEGRYGHWGEDSWPGWVDDVARLNERIRADHPGCRWRCSGTRWGRSRPSSSWWNTRATSTRSCRRGRPRCRGWCRCSTVLSRPI